MKIMIPFADGFEDIEAITVVDVLRRAGIKVDTVGVVGSVITSKNGVRVMVDKRLNEVKAEDYDGIVLPGGSKGVENLSKTASLLEMIKKINKNGKLVCAICAAPSILARIGILDDKKATIFPGMEGEIPYPRSDRVVVDGNVVTSQAAGTAMEFSLKLVEILAGKKKAEELREHLVV